MSPTAASSPAGTPGTPGTTVTFPAGGLVDIQPVVVAGTTERGTAVVTASTPFHPVDAGWPDQGPDRGTLTMDGAEHDVVDVVIGAVGPESDGGLLLGADIPVRRGTPGWSWLVVHLLDGSVPPPAVGSPVTLTVDAAHRAALSAGHTVCHLAALALDAALADRWRKLVETDPLGRPAFDAIANTASRVVEYGSLDSYRLGKSLRKKGFDADGLDGELPAIAAAVASTVDDWLATGGAVRIETDGPLLADRRRWVCELPQGRVELPCGGTHVETLAAIGPVAVALTLSPDGTTLEMTTRTGPADPADR